MWQFLGWIAWAISAAIFAWLIYDFFKINTSFSEETLLSSREGVDELFPDATQIPGE